MKLSNCVCGSAEIIGCRYFYFEGDKFSYPRNAGGCRDCLIDNNAFCTEMDDNGDEHGPVTLTNDPSFHGIRTIRRIPDNEDMIGFCVQCIEDDMHNLEQERFDDCASLFAVISKRKSGTAKDLQVLSDRAIRFLASESTWEDSLVLGCIFTNYVLPSSLEQVALEYAYGISPPHVYKTSIDKNLHM